MVSASLVPLPFPQRQSENQPDRSNTPQDYGARYYLPSLRRFISADTVVPGAGNPQALNRYAYVLNSPQNLIDPTGHVPTIDSPSGPTVAEAVAAAQTNSLTSDSHGNMIVSGNSSSGSSSPPATSTATVDQGLREQLSGGGGGGDGSDGGGRDGRGTRTRRPLSAILQERASILWNNTQMAGNIVAHPAATWQQPNGFLRWYGAYAYLVWEGSAAIALTAGGSILASEAALWAWASAQTLVATAGTAGAAVCGDGDCTNELQAASQLNPAGGGPNYISMDNAVEQAVGWVDDSEGIMETTGNGLNYQFRSTIVDASGNTITRVGRLDVNAASHHVSVTGPHLNLDEWVNDIKTVAEHIFIDPSTIRPGDIP